MRVMLSRIAHARSGDKGDTSNIGVSPSNLHTTQFCCAK